MAKKPNQPVDHFINSIPSSDVSFDFDAFNTLIRSQGAKLVHYRAQRCPVGLIDLGDWRRPHPHHEGCSNGFIYTKVGTITAFMSGNSKSSRVEDVGVLDHSSVSATFTTDYDDCDEPFVVAPFDRFYLEEEALNVVMWELFQHSTTGYDRLKYPVEAIQGDIIDARGERYLADTDVKACNGQLEWIGRQPTPELNAGPGLSNGFSTDRGMVCSVRYLYRPYWYCGVITHEIRMAQIQDELTGERTVRRMPQAVQLHREYVPLNQEQPEEGTGAGGNDSDALRRVLGAMNGSFGPK